MRWVRQIAFVVVTVLFLLVMGMWLRSFVRNDTWVVSTRQRLIMIDSVRGEMSVWVGTVFRTPPGWYHVSFDAQDGRRATELFRPESALVHLNTAGFLLADADGFPGLPARSIGLVHCLAVPYWAIALLAMLPPIRGIMIWRQPATQTEGIPSRCRHCGSDRRESAAVCGVCGEE